MTNTCTLNSVERACAELLRNGQAVTFTAVAARTGLGRTTSTGTPCSAVSSRRTVTAPPPAAPLPPTDEIATLHAVLDTLATTVRRHEEQLRKLTTQNG